MKKLVTSLFLAVAVAFAASPTVRAGEHERHPEIHAAIHALEKAKEHLQAADHDFGGHRAEAVEACDRAIHQLHLALEADRH